MTRIGISIALLCLVGCAAYDETRATSDAGEDAGTMPPMSFEGATTNDAFPASDDSDYAAEDDAADPTAGLASSRTCVDGLDNDDGGGLDCDDPDCAAIASCSVGNGNLCTPVGSDALPFGMCDDSTVTSACLTGLATPFGGIDPWIASGVFHPGGNPDPAGVLFEDTILLRSHRATLKATFRQPTCFGAGPCMDTVSVGVTGQSWAELDRGARIRAQVALAYGGSRGQVSLLMSGTVARSWPFHPETPDWSLVLRPDGLIDVFEGLDSVFEGEALMPYTPIDGARVIVYGRSSNPPDTDDGAGLTGFEVSTAVCDIPTAWEDRGPVDLALGGSRVPLGDEVPAQVSIELGGADEPRHYVVYRDSRPMGQGSFIAAFEGSAGPNAYFVEYYVDDAVLEPGEAYDSGGIADPEIYWDELEQEWHLYYTAVTTQGLRSIAHARGASLGDLVKDGLPIITPSDYFDLDGIEMPSYVRSDLGDEILIVRGVQPSGAHSLLAFARTGRGWARVLGSDLETLTYRAPDPTGAHFDANEVAHPSIVRVGGSYHIYYAGRRGTRWGIGLFATDELRFVRDVTADGPILAGSQSGFDALGILEPDVLIEDGTVSLFYIGTDGAERTMGRVARQTGGTP